MEDGNHFQNRLPVTSEEPSIRIVKKARPKIIAIGGGKGGVGKSIMAANLSVLLALIERHVTLVDMDFGSANLHTFMGVKSPATSIKDFLLKKGGSLSELLLDTQVDKLRFISGAGDMPGLANMKHFQKLKIIRHLEALEGDYIVLDLAPGITFNVLDFFSVADKTILVTTPESTSVTNTFSFIKAALFRKLSRAFKGNSEIMALLHSAKDPRNVQGIRTFAELEILIEKISAEHAQRFRSIRESFKPQFILNMVRSEDEKAMSQTLISLVGQYLNVTCECLGCVQYDDSMPDSVANMRPFVLEYPQSDTAASLLDIALRITGVLPEYSLPALLEGNGIADGGGDSLPETEESETETKQEQVSENETVEVTQSSKPTNRWATHVSSERPGMGEN